MLKDLITPTMSLGMLVVVQNLNKRPELNGCRGKVVSVHTPRLCVKLDGSEDLFLLKAKNVRQYACLDSVRRVQTFEFKEGTSENEIENIISNYIGTHSYNPEIELIVIIRPCNAISSECMSVHQKSILVSSARLEHMGRLSETAQVLGWIEECSDSKNMMYKNHSTKQAVPSTKFLYLNMNSPSVDLVISSL